MGRRIGSVAATAAGIALLSGCAWIGGGLDRANAQLVQQLTDYCAQPEYRRQALYILANGALEANNITVAVICPGDEVE